MALPTRVQRGQQYDPFELAQREFDTMLGRFLGERQANGTNGGTGALAPYAVDVREDGDHIYVEAELPGFRKEDVDITLENQTLTISAQRTGGNVAGSNGGGQPQQQQRGNMLLNERRYTRFLRSFTLPPTVDEQNVDAKLQDGVLTITLNKREETKPRKVQVS